MVIVKIKMGVDEYYVAKLFFSGDVKLNFGFHK